MPIIMLAIIALLIGASDHHPQPTPAPAVTVASRDVPPDLKGYREYGYDRLDGGSCRAVEPAADPCGH